MGGRVRGCVHASENARCCPRPRYNGSLSLCSEPALSWQFPPQSRCLPHIERLLACRSVLVVGYFCQYLPIIALEEAYLLASCGSVYQTYREQVPRFVPQFRPYPEPSDHDFSLARAIKSEKRTLTAIVCVIGLIFVRQAISVL